MKNRIKDYFNYTSSERKGAIALIIIILIVFSGYWIISLFEQPSSIEVKNFSDEISNFLNSEEEQADLLMPVVYFDFDPNEIDKESWMKLGFTEKQSLSIIKYREKGGYFYKKEDLKRLYVVNDSVYSLLAPHVIINNKSSYSQSTKFCYFIKLAHDTVPIYDGFSNLEKVLCNKNNNVYSYFLGGFPNRKLAEAELVKIVEQGYSETEIVKESCSFGFVINKEKKSDNLDNVKVVNGNSNSLKSQLNKFKVEINSADTSEFKSLKGIGSYYAKRIVKYRAALGGFSSVEQIKEVYGIQVEVVDQNLDRLTIDIESIEKININTCQTLDLKKHPYINWNIANSIVQIRKNHAPYKSVEEIKKSDLVNDEIYRTIAPYLKIE